MVYVLHTAPLLSTPESFETYLPRFTIRIDTLSAFSRQLQYTPHLNLMQGSQQQPEARNELPKQGSFYDIGETECPATLSLLHLVDAKRPAIASNGRRAKDVASCTF